MLFGNQNDYSFIASICIPIVPFGKTVYLSDSHSRDVVGIPNENGFSNVSNFQTTKLLFVNSAQLKFENQLINFVVSDFSYELIPISLIKGGSLSGNEN